LQAKKKKKYVNPLMGKAKLLAIVSIVLIITISYGLFFYLENTSEQNIRNRMIEREVQIQLKYMQAISRHIGTDLTVVVDNLHGLANSKYIQQGDLSSNKTKRLAQETYSRLNGRDSTIDRLVIVDKKGFETVGLTTKGEKIFAGTNISLRPWARETLKSKAPTFSNGFVGLDGQYRIAIGYPITNLENGQYTGLLGALVPFETFLSQYGNVNNANSKYLVAYDKNATILVTAMSKALIGKNFFANYSQQFIKHNKVLTDFVRNLLAGKPGYAIYNYGEGESLSAGYPIYVNGKAPYFIRIVAPTAEIYSRINDVLFTERVKMFSLIAGTTAAVAILIVFLIKWSSLSEEVKRRGKQLEEANKELETVNKAQQEFIDIAAHELRTPIQPIISLSDVLMHKIRDNESRQLIDTVLRNAKRLQRLSQDILDVTKIESGLLKLNKEYLNLKEVISDTVDNYRNQIKNSKRNIRLVYGFDKKEETKQGEGQQQKQLHKELLTQDYNTILEADKGRIMQVIDNLLGNALKFTEEGDISVSVESKGGHAVVSVKDTGRGIDPEIFPRLFAKFATKSKTGTGLGLFICKGIIEAHGGRIWAENNSDGKGATVAFSLPSANNNDKSYSNFNNNSPR
jgi:signal transduction histidine kinase